MLKLIVHADDFGLSESVNNGILQAYRDGILTSTSLMANGAAFEHAVDICQREPALDVGAHLTLVEESPILPPAEIPSLLNRDGRFLPHATQFAGRYLRGGIRMSEVRLELDAQLRKITSRGIRPSHVDSHQHVHLLPRVLDVTVSLAHQFGIPYIRFPGETMRGYMFQHPASLSRVLQLAALRVFCRLGKRVTAVRTDHFAGFFFGGRLNTHNLDTVLRHLPPSGVCELMCHPGLDDPATSYGHWGYRPAEELRALLDPGIAAVLHQRGVELVAFRELGTA